MLPCRSLRWGHCPCFTCHDPSCGGPSTGRLLISLPPSAVAVRAVGGAGAALLVDAAGEAGGLCHVALRRLLRLPTPARRGRRRIGVHHRGAGGHQALGTAARGGMRGGGDRREGEGGQPLGRKKCTDRGYIRNGRESRLSRRCLFGGKSQQLYFLGS